MEAAADVRAASETAGAGHLLLGWDADCRQKAFSYVWPQFQTAGEVLPVLDEAGQELHLLNVTECLNVLDREHTEFRRYSGGEGYGPVKYAFFSNRFSEASIFMIPEGGGLLYALERDNDPDTEFKAAVELHRLQGLQFKEIWDSEKS